MIRVIDLLTVCNEGMALNIFNNQCELVSCCKGREDVSDDMKHKWIEWVYPVRDNLLNIGIS